MPYDVGIGLTICLQNSPTTFTTSVPIQAHDVTRTEALGPPIAELLISTLPATSHYHFIGDSRFVVDMFTGHSRPADLFNYHCRELTCNLMHTRLLQASWAPREFNEECDPLAHAAATLDTVAYSSTAEF